MINTQDSLLVPITEQCRLTGVNRSTWYYTAVDESDENVRLMQFDRLHLDNSTWGSRTIRDHLFNQGSTLILEAS